jgi:hypothetical protein
MFCDQCGAHLQSGQSRCVRCGKPITGPMAPTRSRVREHVKLLAILWMAYSLLHVATGILAIVASKFFMMRMMTIPNGPSPEMLMWMRPVVSMIGWLILAKAAIAFITGWGLLQREEWARVVALVIGFVGLLSVPIGTALGIYTLWVLLPSQSEREYKELAQAA